MAYNVCIFSRLDVNADGSVLMVLTHKGNAGELDREQLVPYQATVPPTADTLRALAMDKSATLNRTRNFVIGATPNIGASLDITTPLLPPPPSTFGAFVAASAPFTPGATPQDVFTITGSATRLVQVTRLSITTVQNVAGMNAWSVVKRSAANQGGTAQAVTRVPLDDAYPAPTATVLQYTSTAATDGTLVGNIWSGRIASPAVTSAAGDFEKVIEYGGTSQPVRLTGITDVLAWNFGGAALPPGLSLQACVWWTER